MTAKNYILFILSFIIGLILTIIFLKFDNLGINNTGWILKYDTISDFLALKFFINDNWHFPLGLNPNYGELKNSIVFSGAVPILSFLSKSFKTFLPYNFHFFSIWICICFSLHIFFSYKIIYYLTKDIYFSIIATSFFLFTPILFHRLEMHLSLGAHWIIIAYIYLEINKQIKNNFGLKVFLIIFSSLIHFYFTVILLIMNFTFSFCENLKTKNVKKFIKNIFLISFLLLLTMYIVGYFSIPVSDSLGFGYGFYKANLLTFFDPSSGFGLKNWSLFLPDIENTKGEIEGFGYLGLGIIILIFILSLVSIKNYKQVIKYHFKYLIVIFIFLIVALSSTISVGALKIVELDLPIFLYAPLSIIRASGRFIWPIYYLLIIFSLFVFYKLNFKKRYLAVILLIQLVDISPGIYSTLKSNDYKKINNKLSDPLWSVIASEYKNLQTTKISNTSKIFPEISELLMKYEFQSTNISRLGRYDRSEASILRSKLYLDLFEKKVDTKTIYIIDNYDHLRHLKQLYLKSNHGFFLRNNIWLFLPNKKSLMNEEDINRINKIQFLKIENKKKYEIRQNSKHGFLGLGWSHSSYGRKINNKGAWSEGYVSSLIFKLEDEFKSRYTNLFFSKILTKNNKNLDLEIFINNKFYKKLNLKSLPKSSFDIEIKNDNFINGINVIDFKIKNPVTPISKLESVDGRLLGFLLESIETK